MKALSIHPQYAMAIAAGEKTIEVRSWNTNYRGTIVICSTNKLLNGTIPGHALCTVELIDVVPLKREHLKDAMLNARDFKKGLFAWVLDDNRMIKPTPVKGKLGLWNYTGETEYIPFEEWVQEDGRDESSYHWYEDYWLPITTGK